MMKPISTFGQTQLRNTQLRSLESELATANNELATGQKEDVAKSIGSQLLNLQSIRNQYSENEAYLRSISTFKQRYDLIDRGLGEAELGINSLVEVAAINGADALESAGSIALVAESAIDRIITALNVQVGGRYLLGGAEVDERPLQPFSVVNASGLSPEQVGDEITQGTAAYLGAAADLTLPADSTEAEELLNRFNDVFQGANGASGVPGQEEYSFEQTIFNGQIAGDLVRVRLPNNTVETQLNDKLIQGLRDVLQGAYILSTVDLENIDDEAAYRRIMTGEADPIAGLPEGDGALDLISRGLSLLQESRADLGLLYQVVDAAEEATEAQNALFNNEIVALEGVDRAEVTTRLLDVENQLQASYSATGRVLNLSIWNFVR